jgi:hypothetical protein
MNCVNMKERYGRSYRVVSEDGNSRNSDPWLWQIPFRYGHLYPHGGTRLGAATTGRRIGQTLAKLPGVRIEQEAEDGYNLTFDVADFRKVAAIIRPRRRRQLSPEQRARLVAAGAEPLKRLHASSKVDRGAPESPGASQPDHRAVRETTAS